MNKDLTPFMNTALQARYKGNQERPMLHTRDENHVSAIQSWKNRSPKDQSQVCSDNITLLPHHLDGVLSSPFPSRRFIPRAVRFVYVCNFRYQRIIGVGIGEHGAD